MFKAPGSLKIRGRMARVVNGMFYVQLLAVAGVATVLITRAYLSATGYPQIGNGSLHVAHALWGGALMLAALVIALLFAGTHSRVWTALLGGVGLGLFIDEVGKFVTQSNDYFYRPTPAIIYIVFAAVVIVASQIQTRRPADRNDRVAQAIEGAATGMRSGLTENERREAENLLADSDDEASRAARVLLELAPKRTSRWRISALGSAVTRLLRSRPVMAVVIGGFLVSRPIIMAIFVFQAISGSGLDSGSDTGAFTAGAVSRTVSAVLAVAAIACWRSHRSAVVPLTRAAVLVDLLISVVFNLVHSQFTSVAELPFLLLVLAVTTRADLSGASPMSSLSSGDEESTRGSAVRSSD